MSNGNRQGAQQANTGSHSEDAPGLLDRVISASTKRTNEIRETIKSSATWDQILDGLGGDEHMAKRLLRLSLTAVGKSSELAACSDQSIGLAMLTATQLGIEPDGRNAYLIAYKSKHGPSQCQLIPSYMGLCMLACRNPAVESISGESVFANDKFGVRYGSDPWLEHCPKTDGERGEFRGAWAICRMHSGGSVFKWMTVDDIDKRRQSAQTDTVWSMWPHEMAVKTVIKRLTTTLPIGGQFAEAVAHTDALDAPAATATPRVDRLRRRSQRRNPPLVPPPDPPDEPEAAPQYIDLDDAHRPVDDDVPDDPETPPGAASAEQLAELDSLRKSLGMRSAKLDSICNKLVGVKRYGDLGEDGARTVIADLREMANPKDEDEDAEAMIPTPEGAEQPAGEKQDARMQALSDAVGLTLDEVRAVRREFGVKPGGIVTMLQYDGICMRIDAMAKERGMLPYQATAVENMLGRLGLARSKYEQKCLEDYKCEVSGLSIADATHFCNILRAAVKAIPADKLF